MCQGRGSAANSAVCFCLGITAVDPVRMGLFVRSAPVARASRAAGLSISTSARAPRRSDPARLLGYGRDHARCVATSSATARAPRCATSQGRHPETRSIAPRSISRCRRVEHEALARSGLAKAVTRPRSITSRVLSDEISSSRVISRSIRRLLLGHEPVHDIVPIENAAMPGRTVIQWDKDDLEDLGLFKVVCSGSAPSPAPSRARSLRRHRGLDMSMATIPAEDSATYDMICTADTVGTFQIESRAQDVDAARASARARSTISWSRSRSCGLARSPRHGPPVPAPAQRPRARRVPAPVSERSPRQDARRAAVPGAGDAARGRRRRLHPGRSRPAPPRHGRVAPQRPHRKTPRAPDLCDGEKRHRARVRRARLRTDPRLRRVWISGEPRRELRAHRVCDVVDEEALPAGVHVLAAQCAADGVLLAATIVGDAQRHGLEIRPIDVNESHWDCTLEPAPDDFQFAVRMGLRWIKGTQIADGERIVAARRERAFASIEDFVRRAHVPARMHGALAEAGALGSLAPARPDRRGALWQVLGGCAASTSLSSSAETCTAMSCSSRCPSSTRSSGLPRERSLDARPSARTAARRAALAPLARRAHRLARARRPAHRVRRRRDLPPAAGHGVGRDVHDSRRRDRVRQPRGVAQVFAEYSAVIRTTSLLGVTGKLQVQEGIVHVIAEQLWVPKLSRPIADVESRDFH